MIAATIKAFKLSWADVLYNISYANVVLMGASLPSYHSKDDKRKQHHNDQQETINADDPKNNSRVLDFINQ